MAVNKYITDKNHHHNLFCPFSSGTGGDIFLYGGIHAFTYVLFTTYICSFHVNWSYWQTGWESGIIDLNYTLILLNQSNFWLLINFWYLLALVAEISYLSINPLYLIIYVRITLLSCTAFTLCTLSIPPVLEYLVPLLEDANLSIDICTKLMIPRYY